MIFDKKNKAKREKRIADFHADAETRLAALTDAFNATADIADPGRRYMDCLNLEAEITKQKDVFLRDISENPKEGLGIKTMVTGFGVSTAALIACFAIPEFSDLNLGAPHTADCLLDYIGLYGTFGGIATSIAGMSLSVNDSAAKHAKKELQADINGFDDLKNLVAVARKKIPSQNMETFARSAFFDEALDRVPELEKSFQRYAMKRKIGVTEEKAPIIRAGLEL